MENEDWRSRVKGVGKQIERKIQHLEESRDRWQGWALAFHNMMRRPPYGVDEAVQKVTLMEEFKEFYEQEPAATSWLPIEKFNGETFSIMTNGLPDCTEVVKYKGTVPQWARWWKPLPALPR